ncbi:MAG: hypothetical protein MZV64_60195 [Ignavibacteriales bacterium]|nr:hypothetical protein [Ignavibacteriales bacterium]
MDSAVGWMMKYHIRTPEVVIMINMSKKYRQRSLPVEGRARHAEQANCGKGRKEQVKNDRLQTETVVPATRFQNTPKSSRP